MAMGLVFLASTTVVHADNPPANTIQSTHQGNPQVKKLIAEAMQALKNAEFPLAMIELKNALRLEPNNGALHTLLGIALLQSNQPSPAEHELRQGRLEGAMDQDVVPPLVQSMVANKEWTDVLDQFPDPAPSDKSALAASILRARSLAYQFTGDEPDAISSVDRSLKIMHDLSGLLLRAEIALFQSNASDAMTYTNQALALAPSDPSALMMKADIVSAGDKKAALAILDSVLKAHPSAVNATMARIPLLLELSRNDEAQQSVDAVLAQYPNIPAAIFYKALLLGMHNKPVDGWRIAQSLPPEFFQSAARFAVGAAQLAANSGNLESANSILTIYVGQHPGEVDPRLHLASLHLRMSTPSDALNDLEPLMDSGNPRVLEFIADTYATLKRPGDSVAYLRKADAAGSKSSGVKFQLAMADLTQGNTSRGTQEMLDGMKIQPGNLDGPRAGINLLMQQSKFVEAQTLADQAEKSNPKDPAPPFFKGEILLAQDKKDESLLAINRSLQRDANYSPALYDRIDIFIAQNKYADATNDSKLIQAQQPNNPLPYVKLAEIAALSKQPTQSLALLNQAISKDPKLIANRIILAKYQASLTQYADAETTLKSALQVFPNDPQLLALYGQVEELLGQKTAAVATDRMLVEKNQQSGAAQGLLADSLLQSGDKKGAIVAFKRAIELNPDILQYRTSLIDLEIQSADNEAALATARDWRSSHSGPDADILLAETMVRLNRLPEAQSIIATSQKSQPDSRLTILDGHIAMARGNASRAISILKHWLIDYPSDIQVRKTYAAFLMRSNSNAAALAQYEIVLKSQNDDPQALNNTAWLVMDSDASRALSLASKAMQLQPNSSNFADTVGFVLWKKGDARGALAVLQRAHAIEPASGEISYHLALALISLGRKADAKQMIQAALANDDKFLEVADAKKLLEKL